jgi:L-ribulokinase
MPDHYTIGLDFGTESVRAALANVRKGEVIASAIYPYPDGVIYRTLPSNNHALPPDFALQNPADWLTGLEETIRQVMLGCDASPQLVIGLGIDFTACTILPTTADGKPLSDVDTFRNNPHAWVKLWKHHAAQPQADQVNELAKQRNEAWLSLYGGKISSEWVLPKALQIYQEAPEIYEAADCILEGVDWVVWQLTGRFARNACGAGYKANWHKVNGYPSAEFLDALKPGFGQFFQEKFAGEVVPPATCVGRLSQVWSERLGLPVGIPVAAGMIDAHAAMIGAGITKPHVMFMIMGTSTCHMLMAEKEERVPGISGVVEDGIVPGLFGYEAGQAGVGDIFAWFIESSVPPVYHAEANKRGITLHSLLSEKAALVDVGQSGLLALDWLNGCRTPLVSANLSGLLIGANLATTPEEIYRTLIEATAYGTRLIIETFIDKEISVDQILAGGGLTKNSFLMQIYADITEREIGVLSMPEVSALGAAMLASVAAGKSTGGYANLSEAAVHMRAPVSYTYKPRPETIPVYRRLYAEYIHLVDYFGRGGSPVMETLRQIRQESLGRQAGKR